MRTAFTLDDLIVQRNKSVALEPENIVDIFGM